MFYNSHGISEGGLESVFVVDSRWIAAASEYDVPSIFESLWWSPVPQSACFKAHPHVH